MTTEALTGLILAGGKSTRFGSDKASAPLRGKPLLQWAVDSLEPAVEAMVIVRAAGQRLPAIDLQVPTTEVEDEYEAMGPLAGLVTGFKAVRTALCFATSCDAPLLRPAIVGLLASRAANSDVVVPFVGGYMQPLAAVYRPATCGPVFEADLHAGKLRIVPTYDRLRTVVVEEPDFLPVDPALVSFRNANRPERLAEIEALLTAGDA